MRWLATLSAAALLLVPTGVQAWDLQFAGPLPGNPCIPNAGVSGDAPFLIVDDRCIGSTPDDSPPPSDSSDNSTASSGNSTGGP